MNEEKILRGVPKAHYGAFGGVTPFPICLKAVSDYLGDELDYTYAIVACGGAFRFAWNTAEWDGGNVDIMYAYGDAERPFRLGVEALGRGFNMLWREGRDMGHPCSGRKEDFKSFTKEQIDMGRPLISLGPIGPCEAGILTGYKDNGDTLLGWSVFQNWEKVELDDEGYFIADKWWEEGDFVGVMALGDITGPRWDAKEIIANGIAALEGRQEGSIAKGVAAYDAWKKAILGADKKDFAMECAGMNLVMMCQGDATDCLIDGRSNACKYFMALAEEYPDQPLYGEIAAQFGIVADTIHKKVFKALHGHQRGRKQERALKKIRTRKKIGAYIEVMKEADVRTLALMEEVLGGC